MLPSLKQPPYLSSSSLNDLQFLKVRPQRLGCPLLAIHPFESRVMCQGHSSEVETHETHTMKIQKWRR